MKVDEYKAKMKLLLIDIHAYKIVKRNTLTFLQNKLKKILIELNNINTLEKKYNNPVYEFSLTYIKSPKGYELPKVHKPDIILRIVNSTIDRTCHHLAKILYKKLDLCIKIPQSQIDNSFALMKKLKNIDIPADYILLSLAQTYVKS